MVEKLQKLHLAGRGRGFLDDGFESAGAEGFGEFGEAWVDGEIVGGDWQREVGIEGDHAAVCEDGFAGGPEAGAQFWRFDLFEAFEQSRDRTERRNQFRGGL